MTGVIGDDAVVEAALRHLMEAWEATADAWRDQARADFALQHLDPITASARDAARAIRQVETLLGEVTRQCQ